MTKSDHNSGCASLQPTPRCNCLRGAWRRAKRRAANMFKRGKVTVIETKVKAPPSWVPCHDCDEMVPIQWLTMHEHVCKEEAND